jgi:tetratricopeptide (TPR) repeat protein
MSKGAVVCLCLVAIGCGTRLPAVSGDYLSAVRLSERGAAAFERGDHQEALQIYKIVLDASRANEDYDGIASSLINMAIVQRSLGNAATAQKYLAEILQPARVPYTPLQRSQAALLEAMLCLDKGDLIRAEQWATDGLTLCQRSRCAMRGKYYNVQSRIALAQGNPERAIAAATTALEINREQGDGLEEANSLRLSADARMLTADYENARTLYEGAYRLDQARDRNTKSARDLLGIGRTYVGQGKFADGLDYYRRALAVSERNGDTGGATTASRLIQEAEARRQK